MAMAERVNIPVLPWGAIVETEQWNLRALTDMRVEGCRRRLGQANPPHEPNLKVRGPLRGSLTARVIILPRKSAKHNSLGTRTANRHRWTGRTYSGVERLMVKELGKLTP